MRIKSKNIAEALGVSTATVSLALNNKPGVNKETRDKILAYVESVKNLKTIAAVSKRIAIVLPERCEDDNGQKRLFMISYNEIFYVLQKSGYALELIYFDLENETPEELIASCKSKNVCGIFLCACSMNDRELDHFEFCEIPLLIFDNDYFSPGADNVLPHNKAGTLELLRYLKQAGHSNIVYIATNEDIANFRQRRAAYCSFCENTLQLPSQIITTGYSINEIFDKVTAFLDSEKTLPTAFFAESFQASIGCIKAILGKGLRIPEDISIVGFDELPETALLNFKLTSSRVLHKEAAALAAKHFLDRIENDETPSVELYVHTKLLIGDSVKQLN